MHQVLRDGKWTELDSRELVPGDVCEIKSDWLLPCDFVILEVGFSLWTDVCSRCLARNSNTHCRI